MLQCSPKQSEVKEKDAYFKLLSCKETTSMQQFEMKAQPRSRFHVATSCPCSLPSCARTTCPKQTPAPKRNDVKSLGWVLNAHKYHSREPGPYILLQLYSVLSEE